MRNVSKVFVAVTLAVGGACAVKDPLYCSADHMCSAGLPYCDTEARFPSSGDIKNTCIEQPYATTVEVAGPGSVTSEPPGIACPGDCDELYENGTTVTLRAVPTGGNQFGGWTGDCTGMDPTCVVTATATHAVVARFGPPVHYAVTVQGMGAVVSEPAGINCPGTCDATFPPYSHVKMTAMAADGSAFTSWTGGCTGANPSCETDATKDTTLSATFARQLSLTITMPGDGQGHVTSTDGLIDCSTTCTKVIGEGASITLNHAAFGDSGFDGWGGPCTGEDQCAFTLNNSTTVTAAFRAPWVRTPTFGVNDAASDVVVTSAGDIYVTGWETPMDVSKPHQGMILKYDKDGNQLWAYAVCGSTTIDCAPQRIALDSSAASVAIVGSTFDQTTPLNTDWYVESRSAAGVRRWSKAYGNAFANQDLAFGVEIDASGTVYAGGFETVAQADHRALVRGYDSNGNLLWSPSSTFKNSQLTSLAVDSLGEVWGAGFDFNNPTTTPWFTFYTSSGVVGTRKTLTSLVPYDLVGIPSFRLALVGSSTGAAGGAVDLLDSGRNSLWVVTEPLVDRWNGTCVDPAGPFVYTAGAGMNAGPSIVDGYDDAGNRILQHQEAGVIASSVGCDPSNHDVVVVGSMNGKIWIKHYYR